MIKNYGFFKIRRIQLPSCKSWQFSMLGPLIMLSRMTVNKLELNGKKTEILTIYVPQNCKYLSADTLTVGPPKSGCNSRSNEPACLSVPDTMHADLKALSHSPF